MLDQRVRLLLAALGFALVPPTEPERRLLHRWLDSSRRRRSSAAGGEALPLIRVFPSPRKG